MVVRFGTLAPLKTPIKVLTVVVQSASTLLSMDVISGSVQRARRELLYPIILSSSGMEIPAVWAYFTAPTASESSEAKTASNFSPSSFRLKRIFKTLGTLMNHGVLNRDTIFFQCCFVALHLINTAVGNAGVKIKDTAVS